MKICKKTILIGLTIFLCTIFFIPIKNQAKVTRRLFLIYIATEGNDWSEIRRFFLYNRSYLRNIKTTKKFSGDMEGTILDHANFNIDRVTRDAVSWGQLTFVSNDGSYAWSGYYTNKITNIWIPYKYTWKGIFVTYGSGTYD